ncbi:hypothetical protein ACE6H2_019201 [Prunus campanulata]
MMQLEYFDVSSNKLSGQIPEKVCSLTNLFYLNFAENRLEGPIPKTGICQNLSKILLAAIVVGSALIIVVVALAIVGSALIKPRDMENSLLKWKRWVS